MKAAVKRKWGGEIVPENSPKGESQSNGATEEAGKTVREMVRVFKEQLEFHADMKLGSDDHNIRAG